MTDPTSGTQGSGSLVPARPITGSAAGSHGSAAPAAAPAAPAPKVAPGLSASPRANIHQTVDEDLYALGLAGNEFRKNAADRNRQRNDGGNPKFDRGYEEARANYNRLLHALDDDIAAEIDEKLPTRVSENDIKVTAARVVQSHIRSYPRSRRQQPDFSQEEQERAASNVQAAAALAIADEMTLRLTPAEQAKIIINKVFEASPRTIERQFIELGTRYENAFYYLLTSPALAKKHRQSDADIKAALQQNIEYQAIIKARARFCFDMAKKTDSHGMASYDVGSIVANVEFVKKSHCPEDIRDEFLDAVKTYATQKRVELPATLFRCAVNSDAR